MIDEIKQKLIENPIHIQNILEHYGFYHISISSQEIRCGIGEDTNRTSIRIKLQNNDYLYVSDFGRGVNRDFINFIMESKNVTFKDVINTIKKEIGIESFYFEKRKSIFGGFYDKVKYRKGHNINLTTYDESILDKYVSAFNLRFLRDNIDLETQKFFNVMYDIESQRIVFPIYDWEGNIIGVKGRANWNIDEDDSKYLYLVSCYAAFTLYGYCQNYSYLQNNIIIVVESEKSVMTAYSYGYRNVIALCGNTITSHQAKLIMSLNPKEIIIALDAGLDTKILHNNIKTLKPYIKMRDTKIKYWDYENSKYVSKESKNSLIDLGKDIFEKILKEEILEDTNG